jgi:phenylalanyl-tRNA synthetase beta subunit
MSGLSLGFSLGLTAQRGGSAEPPPPLLDNFTAADTTNLSAHTADSGEAWTAVAGAMLVNGNKVYPSTVTALYASAWTPASAEYDVEAEIEFKTVIATQAAYILGRYVDANNFYYCGVKADGKWVLGKRVASTFTELGAAATGPAGGNTYTVRLEVRNATKTLFIDDVQTLQSADNALATAGVPAIRVATVASATTTGAHYDSITASNP